jgi:hypothetical protein
MQKLPLLLSERSRSRSCHRKNLGKRHRSKTGSEERQGSSQRKPTPELEILCNPRYAHEAPNM